jgi:transcriptional regulator with XRE-family HTH domain
VSPRLFTVINERGTRVLSDVVGRQVRVHREMAKLTREQLAERCAAFGFPVTAAMVNYIESGRPDASGQRRREVTVDELAVLALALDVPPLALLAPITDEPWGGWPAKHPGAPSTANALAWLRGNARLLGRGATDEPRVYWVLRTYLEANEAAWELYRVMSDRDNAPDTFDPTPSIEGNALRHMWAESYERALKAVRSLRGQLRANGDPLPVLPLGLEWVDGPQSTAPQDADRGSADG